MIETRELRKRLQAVDEASRRVSELVFSGALATNYNAGHSREIMEMLWGRLEALQGCLTAAQILVLPGIELAGWADETYWEAQRKLAAETEPLPLGRGSVMEGVE